VLVEDDRDVGPAEVVCNDRADDPAPDDD